MADYVSALNGQQMDAALMDMALHNSEAWAVGTRNGYEVESDDITWENNAKYYASVAGESSTTATTAASSASESASTASSAATAAASDATRAEDAADRAEAIVGGQFVSYGQTQGLTDAQKLQARANISAGASNRNLLDNPFFTVNQRNFTSQTASAATLCVDRWYIARCTASLSGNTISITKTSGQNNCYLSQHIDKTFTNGLVGKTVTLSAIIDGTLRALTGVVKSNGDFNGVVTSGITFALENHVAGYGEFVIYISDTAAHSISCVKLELGSYSTLANDVPPDYKTELDKCQYYYRELKAITATYLAQGVSVAGTNFRVILPYTMRTRPSVTYSGTLTAYYSGGNAPVTAISVAGTISDAVQLSFTTSGISGANQPVSLDAAAGAKICLSADL